MIKFVMIFCSTPSIPIPRIFTLSRIVRRRAFAFALTACWKRRTSSRIFISYFAVVTRFKILADCDISEKRLPQDGAITFRTNDGEDVDTRFNVLPGKNGERICIRLLKGDPSLSIDKIGFKDADLQKLIEAITAPQGVVLVTGPTGSGKTTTLYGALQYINDPGTNIMTAEDPVEYYLEGQGKPRLMRRLA